LNRKIISLCKSWSKKLRWKDLRIVAWVPLLWNLSDSQVLHTGKVLYCKADPIHAQSLRLLELKRASKSKIVSTILQKPVESRTVGVEEHLKITSLNKLISASPKSRRIITKNPWNRNKVQNLIKRRLRR